VNKKTGVVYMLSGVAALVALTGCSQPQGVERSCFSVAPSSTGQPYSPILLDSCTGKSWLLVKMMISGKTDSSFTYQWQAIERFDYLNPVLSTGN
jgi:hypothetical protein